MGSKSNEMREFASLVFSPRESVMSGISNAPRQSLDHIDVKTIQANAALWATSGDTYLPCESTSPTLPAGHYTIHSSPTQGLYFQKSPVNNDEIFELPDNASEEVIDQIQTFWAKEEHFRKFGFLWKRGILLWGPPGSGKTCTVQLICNDIIKRGGLAIYVYNPTLSAIGMKILRKIEPNRPVVAVIEDIDSVIETYGESDMLALLDGEQQIDNVVFIATTNYPENLDRRIINRPSRFDYIKKIGMPSEAARKMYIKKKFPEISASELPKWVEDTENFSIAHIKELIISIEVFGVEYSEAISRLKDMIDAMPTSREYMRDEGRSVGFSKHSNKSR